MPTNPSLGYGSPSSATIDQVNTWMRSTPWYQQLLRSWGQDPGHPHDLTDAQKTQIVRGAQANGVVVDESNQEVDDNGNFRNQGHALRNTLIVAGIAAATIATMGAAGVFGAAGASAGAGAGGVEAGAASGLGAAALPGAGTALGAAGGVGAAGLTAAATVPTAAATVPGLTSGASLAGQTFAGVAGGAGGNGVSAIPWSTVIGVGGQLFGNLFAAHEQGSAADTAAAATAAAAKYSADLTAKANADALKFQYANAENAYQNNEASRQGNYGIFAARERRLGPIGEEVGMAPREVPAYVPGVDPGFGTMGDAATGAPPASSSGAPASGNPTDPNAIMAALTDNYKKLGVAPTGPGSGPTDIAYMAKQIAATGGLAPGNASYWFGPQGRIAQELAKANNGPSSVTASPMPRAQMPATSSTPFMSAVTPQSAQLLQPLGYYA